MTRGIQVTIPFRPFFRRPMLDGIKILTCRTKKMAEPGDTFRAFGAVFEVTDVFKIELGFIVAVRYRDEGCRTPEELVEIWKGIHPRTGYDPKQEVWAHQFKKIGDQA